MNIRYRKFIISLLIMLIIIPQFAFSHENYWKKNTSIVAIKTINEWYLSAEDSKDGNINATKEKIGDKEKFEIVDLGKGYIALKTYNGYYLRVSKDGNSVYADSKESHSRGTFELIILKDNKVAFKTYDDKYLCAEDGGGGKLVANRDEIGSWETFELIDIESLNQDKIQLTVKVDEKGATFNWNKPKSTKDIIGYNLYRGTTSGKESSTPITDFPIEGNFYTDYNIDSNTAYYYILRAVYKDKSLGVPSNEVSVLLKSKIILNAKATEDGVYLNWNKSYDKDIAGYYIYRATASGKQTSTPITDFPIVELSYTDKNVDLNTNYFYILKVVYKDKNLGNATDEVKVKTNSRSNNLVLEVGSKYMYVNGKKTEIDPGKGTVMVITNGRTFLPIRAVIEAMGGEVEWRNSDKRVSIYLNNKTIHLWIGNKTAKVNGSNKETDVAPYISDSGRTMLPLRFIAENLDSEVDWDGPTKKVTITLK